MKLRIGEYKQIDTRYEGLTVLVDDYNERGEVIGQHEEILTRGIPVMGMIYRDETAEEAAERERMQREMEESEANREPTVEERIEAQVMYTALMTDTLLMEE